MHNTKIGQSNTAKRPVTVHLDSKTIEMYTELKKKLASRGEQYSMTQAITDMISKAHSDEFSVNFMKVDADTCFFGTA